MPEELNKNCLAALLLLKSAPRNKARGLGWSKSSRFVCFSPERAIKAVTEIYKWSYLGVGTTLFYVS